MYLMWCQRPVLELYLKAKSTGHREQVHGFWRNLGFPGNAVSRIAEHETYMVKGWDFLEDAGNGLYKMPADRTNLPFMYALRAVKG
jgi:hypothetical protein